MVRKIKYLLYFFEDFNYTGAVNGVNVSGQGTPGVMKKLIKNLKMIEKISKYLI